MIVRTYARRTRCGVGRSLSEPILLDGDSSSSGGGGGGGAVEDAEFLDLPLSQDGSQDRLTLAAFSSQDSSPWSLDPADPCTAPIRPDPHDPTLLLLGDSSDGPRNPGKRQRNLEREVKNPPTRFAAVAAATATLMEAQEFGEMMEHMDEVNFALDGLRPGQPARIRRASLLSLLSICGTAQQRRLLRAQGMAQRIVDAILHINFDDSPSTVAAAALIYVLASDAQDDHLLDSPSCIHFLIKLLNPPVANNVEDKIATIGSKILGIRKPHIQSGMNKGTDSSSTAIISKVQEILLSCKEIKSSNGDDEGAERPELSSKWIALLTMEKACLSTVSFEDASDMVRRVGGNFKERLRELGGLDAIFDVLASCHSTMEVCLKHKSPSLLELKDGSALQSVVLMLKCLKIMENATFLSKDNQDHLLGMERKLDSERLPLSFVGLVICVIKSFSELSLLQNSSSISNKGKSNLSEVQMNDNRRDRGDRTLTSDCAGCSGMDKNFNGRSIYKRQKLSSSQSKEALPGSETTSASGSDELTIKRTDCTSSGSCNGASSTSSRDSYTNGNSLKLNMHGNGLKVNSIKGSKGWISINPNGLKKNSSDLSKRRHMSEDVKGDCKMDSFDPFAFDEGDLEPSKWELLKKKKETSHTHQMVVTNGELTDGYNLPNVTTDDVLSRLTDEQNYHPCENSCPSVIEEDSNLLEDCLLTSVKVLMNLTNDNPVGCQQIAACGGLDTMAYLIISHFPSFDLCFPMNSQVKENNFSSKLGIDAGHPNNRHLSDHELDFLVAILGLLVNLVEKDSRNRSPLWILSYQFFFLICV
ncbi:wings apart-like protein 1 [Phoenix dactylifera]|uniref:Wings apart-like protein 1 n=1 Tax=Phoenix dactylifera TaxID=42345 RepID=A0A8B8ZVM6_PHODC|nr:wings apart-like protein 1 [Phoenix dactylifera]XP_038978775.1 wings apart-like protein 1 [Phoenix dactylifera]